MDIIDVCFENIDKEHICCALSEKKGECQVSSKKAWLRDRFEDGLVFKKGDVRGKAFIEYIPAENAWSPIKADGYMYIDCLWVSGKYKGQGFANILLDECIKDSKNKGKKGLVILSSAKKRPYLSDKKFLEHKGFLLADKAEPYYELLYLPFGKDSWLPKFKDAVRENNIIESGFTIYYSNQCPFTSKYVSMIEEYSKRIGVNICLRKYMTKEDAQNSITPFTTYSLYYNGKFITHEILNEKKFEVILKDKNFNKFK